MKNLNNMINLDYMREQVLRMSNPSDPYSEEDFNKEFMGVGNSTITNNEDYFKLKINFKNDSTNPDPEYATSGSSGFDLRANLKNPITISAGAREIVPTGLFFELPENFEIQVRPRSGLAAKNGVTVLNTPGTIDADYRGEIKVIIINLGQEPFTINHGDRIAQAVVSNVTAKNIINLNRVVKISENTERGTGGFGSTGKN
jgi:dUTP pyrophosphatase